MSGSVRIFLPGTVVGLLLSQAGSAGGVLIEYTDASAFNLATTSRTIITFEGLDTSKAGYTQLGDSVTLSGATFKDAAGMFAVTSGFGSVNNNGNTFLAPNGEANGTVTLPAGYVAAGYTIYSDGSSLPATMEILTSDQQSFSVTISPQVPSYTPPDFLGFIEQTRGVTITSVTFNANLNSGNGAVINHTPSIDNFTFGQQAVPEPVTPVIGSIAGLALFRRRRNAR